MKKYKAMFIVKPDLSEEATKSVIEQVKQIFTNHDSKQVKVDEWGLKNLAYPIDDFTKGYYVVLTAEANAEAVSEFTRICNISETVIRHIIVSEE